MALLRMKETIRMEEVTLMGKHAMQLATMIKKTGPLTSLLLGCSTGVLAPSALATESVRLSDTVVTASRWEEPRHRLSSTVQVISEADIRRSPAASLTDLLSEKAAGFFSEWTPAQTSVNLRGGASDGQGRDFRGQVLVLLNGRRAGTANLSKLSLADVVRVEIVRGPASVAYGSQGMGGVVNVITRNGANTTGQQIAATAGSYDMLGARGHASGELGDMDYYLGLAASRSASYRSGKGSPERMANTSWERRGGLAAFGWDLDIGRIDLTLRRDGVHDAGFRGSSWDLDNYDDRYNESLDLGYSTHFGAAQYSVQGYVIKDVDDFYWGPEVSGIDLDQNNRTLRIQGLRNDLSIPLARGTTLLTGLDLERSELRSTRFRRTLAGVESRIAPQDNNHDEQSAGLYGELVQSLLDERLVLRGGARYTYGRTTSLPTPGRNDLLRRTESYQQVTSSLGASYRLAPSMRLRGGYATGFRAPTATELAADFLTVAGNQILGNPNLDSEQSQQLELGFDYINDRLRLDLALFENRITDRVISRVEGVAPGGGNIARYANNDDDIVVRGLDLQLDYELLPASYVWQWTAFANGSYHFDMRDKGAAPTARTRNPQRIYEYQGAIGSRIGHGSWDLGLTGILRGPMWYDTEERLLIPQGEPSRDYIHRKDAFWVWNLRGGYQLSPEWRLWAGVNNLLNKNEHPIFIALNKEPFISDPAFSNGGRGNSMPGRNYQVGLAVDF